MGLSLTEFIDEIGDAEFAQAMGAAVRTVQSWRRRERLPRPEQAREIVRLGAGRIGFDGIYGQPNADDIAPGIEQQGDKRTDAVVPYRGAA